jgi:hypothetical protein
LVCNSLIHDKNCESYKNNALKGASAEPRQLMFHQNEVQILTNVLEICKLCINKNSSLFQSKDIVNELNQSLKILRPGNSLKGASSNICNKDHLQGLLKLFNLG